MNPEGDSYSGNSMEEQIVSAIEIAWNPSSEQSLRLQATDYCNQLRNDQSAWQPCISIFIKVPRYSDVVRIFVLETVNNSIQGSTLNVQALNVIKDQLLGYLRQLYLANDEFPSESTPIQNKTAQTLTYLFSALYGNGWQAYFDDILDLTSKAQNGARDNAMGTIFYLRVINSIHEEIGDQLVPRSRAEQDRANVLKDMVRERDVKKIARSWQEILDQWRVSNDTIAELCLKAVGKWVSWIDIGLVVNQQMLDLLFEQLTRAQKTRLREGEESIRDAAVDVFTEIIGKKMKPQDKLEMISYLHLETIVSQLIACPPLSDKRFSSQYDTDLAETVARLVNNTVLDVVKTLDSEPQESQIWQRAENVLQSFLPHVLRFFGDEYDEVCSTVIPCLNEVLAFLRKAAKIEGPSPQRAVMLLPILKAIFTKMRYDDTSSWGGDEDETDEAEFQYLRKRLGTLQQTIAAVDEQLYMDAVTSLVGQTFENLSAQGINVDWRDLDLALCEMFSFGDLAIKSGGLYQKNRPNSPAAEKLVRMMLKMVESDIRCFNHPATQLQYMELCVRYCSFFEKHTEYINPVLQNFLQLIHHPSTKVRTRSWYLFQRYVRYLRSHISNVAETVIRSLTDLLPIRAEIPEEETEAASSEDHDSSADAVFNSQLYLFEAIGCICAASSVPPNRQVLYAQSVMSPIFSDVELHLPGAKGGNERAILQVHHDLMALGTLARGFSDWSPGSASATPASVPAPEVQAAFARVSEASLVALKSLRTSFNIRTAARFAFSRLIGVLGSHILPQLPDWIEGLLTETSTKDEMALFLRLLEQVIFGFKNEISTILDELFTPLLQRVFTGLSEPATGTDDEIQLAELKREYLNFLIIILNNDLGSIIVSTTNQPFFETLIGTIAHFAKDAEDSPTAKMAFQVLTKMCSVWGGPDLVRISVHDSVGASLQPSLPGFDQFMISQFSPLCWAVPTSRAFNPKDAQARQLLAEAAVLQKTIYTKTGQEYLSWLRDSELRNMGMNDDMINEYLRNLVELDQRTFKAFFQNFVTKGGRA